MKGEQNRYEGSIRYGGERCVSATARYGNSAERHCSAGRSTPAGGDTINVQEGNAFTDDVFCAPGKKDKVFFDKGEDDISQTCEIKRPG